ncbi:MvdC/MvdD family ATP grasp protein [Saccharopolyspora phatthalungensis]|uniref:ATP-grasp ribosomal peptide maturase n=1 Tax=Saccharopolyspora phatthalungensis TaxID=664693 RepID=A0A840PXP3_9PSEU|nr:RimK domain-containing protein [Saccharopolyspora phatthalungensis]MBB5152530.1 ATP-grasp ribosomal peptide maturase [Saccharopolyspora phatthalungensis]
MSILILAGEHDPSADAMVLALQERETEVHRVDTAWFPAQLSISARLRGGRWVGNLRTEHHVIDLQAITAVWYRAPRSYQFHALNAVEERHARTEAKYGLGGVLASLLVLWVNHPMRTAAAAYKPLQLVIGAIHGLRVPETLITNEADDVREFAAEPTVTKMLGAVSIVEDGRRKFAHTAVLTDADLADLHGVEHTTHQFQRWVDKAHEARVVVIGNRINAFTIHAGSDAGYVDWRTDYDTNSYAVAEPPADVATGVRGMLRELGLVYGAFDFVIGADGEWTLLELNPAGQYGWLEHHTGVDLTGQLADLLMKGQP